LHSLLWITAQRSDIASTFVFRRKPIVPDDAGRLGVTPASAGGGGEPIEPAHRILKQREDSLTTFARWTHVSSNKLERDDDSNKDHPALASAVRRS
jgi:hypothetical protein